MGRKYAVLLALLLAGVLGLPACRTAAPGAGQAPNAVAPSAGTLPAGAPSGATPRVGGTLVFGVEQEPDTLDAHKTAMSVASDIMCMIGGSLVALDPADQVVPYLAERWEASADGLTWTFYLKPGVTFHDGTPFTARDYVYTLERALDPQTASRAAGALLGPVKEVDAPDERTLVITLAEPFFPLLTSLTACGYLMPLSRATVEARGDDYGRQPLSVGPYRFKEWRTGEGVILERNPDFAWGPAFAGPGPYNIGTIEYRFLPDATTRLAALEAGELDSSIVAAKDVQRVRETAGFELYEAPLAGASPMGTLNVRQAPFDDIRVRQAFNLAVNRTGLLEAVTQGHAEVQYGPISRGVLGYWPGVKERGYDYDPARAKALLSDAGYTPGTDGVLEKASGRLGFPLLTRAEFAKDAEVLKEQYKAIGADVTIEVVDSGTLSERLRSGTYQAALMSVIFPDADILYLLYHSSKGVLPVSQVSDLQLDAMLDKTRSTVDPEDRQAWVDQAQARIMEQAYILPLYTPTVYTAVNKRVAGLIVSPNGNFIYNGAYIAPAP